MTHDSEKSLWHTLRKFKRSWFYFHVYLYMYKLSTFPFLSLSREGTSANADKVVLSFHPSWDCVSSVCRWALDRITDFWVKKWRSWGWMPMHYILFAAVDEHSVASLAQQWNARFPDLGWLCGAQSSANPWLTGIIPRHGSITSSILLGTLNNKISV